MKRSLTRAAAVCVCAFLLPCLPAQADMSFAFDLDVSCDDVELRALTRGFFSRSLREIKDVRVGESSVPDYRATVVAHPEGHGWAMSVVITEQLEAGEADPEEPSGRSD